MRPPQKPPEFNKYLSDPKRILELGPGILNPTVAGKYRHWDTLRRLKPPQGLSSEEWWAAIKFTRLLTYKQIEDLEANDGTPFVYAQVDPITERLHTIDMGAGGRIEMPDQIMNPDTRDRYYVNSLIEEAITSSQIEGAATTRRVAKEMLRANRPAANKSERMIVNNYRTMQEIERWKEERLTPDLVFQIHEMVTRDTLEEPDAAGRFRKPAEDVRVSDPDGDIVFTPPPAAELDLRMGRMCAFANQEDESGFVHPVLRAIILHFWLAYDHPFVDGNGRTARALFYWSMLRKGYWLFSYVSISEILRKSIGRYSRAFLYTESDENDLTYFILFQLEVIQRAIDALHKHIERETRALKRAEKELQGMRALNHRQRALVTHALRHPNQIYTFGSHSRSHRVTHQTARTDLLGLEEMGLLERNKAGRVWNFRPAANLEKRLRG